MKLWLVAIALALSATAASADMFNPGAPPGQGVCYGADTGCTNSTSIAPTAYNWQTFATLTVHEAGATVTLPVSTSLQANGGGLVITAVGNSVTLTPNAADAINGGTAGASITLASGSSTIVTTNQNGAIYTTVGGSGLTAIAADSVLANATGGSAVPTGVAFPTSGTNGCAGAANALTYNTSTHALGCNSIAGGGSVNAGTTPNGAYYATTSSAVSDAGAATVTFGGINVTTTTVPALGIYQGAANVLSFAASTLPRMSMSGSSLSAGQFATGFQINFQNSTATAPVYSPVKTAGTSGLGGLANVPAMIVSAATIENWASTGPSILVLPTDATFTDNSLCINTTSHIVYSGSGTLGICLGTSSRRYKHDIEAVNDEALPMIMALHPVSYRYNKGSGDGGLRKNYWLIAEDVNRVAPQCVPKDKGGLPSTVDPVCIEAFLIKGMQEQQAEIDHLKHQSFFEWLFG